MTPRSTCLRALVGSALAAGAGAPALAQEAEPPAAESLEPKITGFVDVTYNYNTRKPMDGTTRFHSYTAQHDTLLLNAAHVALGAATDTISYVVEVDAGSDAIINSSSDARFDVQEAYAAYVSKMGLGIKAGKFVTYEGIEVVESGADPTISRGFLFGLAEPIYHVGALLTYKFSPTLDGALGVVNGWDVFQDNNTGKTFVAKVGYVGDGRLLTVSGIAGPEQPDNDEDWRFSGDATGMVKLGAIDLWFQVNGGSEQGLATDGGSATWIGGGLQPVWHATDALAVGGRVEVFDDNDMARTGVEQTLYNLSVTPAYTLTTGLVLRGELRVDMSSEDAFIDNDGEAVGNQVVVLTEAIYSF